MLADLVDRMLLADPALRPTIAQVHAALMALRGSGETAAPTAPASTAPAPARATGLRDTLVGGRTAPPAPAPPTSTGGLKGKLIGRDRREGGST